MQALQTPLSPEEVPGLELPAPPEPVYRPLWLAASMGIMDLPRLQSVAGHCRRYTPSISLAPPDAVLLEIRGSLELFGGLSALIGDLSRTLARMGCGAALAATPVPSASLAFARQERKVLITERAQLRPALAELPIHALEIPARQALRLERMGISRLADLWRLPRDGLARRFGRGLLTQLDRLAGQVSDPRPAYRPSPRFSDSCMLAAETADAGFVLAAARRLLRRLAEFLRRHDAAVSGFRLLLKPQRRLPIECRVGLRSPSRDLRRLEQLLAVRFQALRLPAPIVELELRAEDIGRYSPEAGNLFPERAAGPGPQAARVREVLEARLGPDCIVVPICRADHRPERAGGDSSFADAGLKPQSGLARPLWLLDPPEPLAGSPPRWQGRPLRLHSGPERIESGWWDGRGERRDYYRAAANGRQLWIFRNLDAPARGWWLHGYWG